MWFFCRQNSDLQVPDVKRLLVDVDGVGARGQAAHSGQVAAVAPHGLDDEDPPLGATGRLLDAITRLNRAHTFIQLLTSKTVDLLTKCKDNHSSRAEMIIHLIQINILDISNIYDELSENTEY